MSKFIGYECPVCGFIVGGAIDNECPDCGCPYSDDWDVVKYDPATDMIIWRKPGSILDCGHPLSYMQTDTNDDVYCALCEEERWE